ncbi:MAG TPA: metallopeptidase TldD-related protein [Bacilli bacterium]|mgnify:CR=1 FL=1|nr:metallopeptidase TldD-related protein [Bacilli bacterium]
MIEKLIKEGIKKDLKLEVLKSTSKSIYLKSFNQRIEKLEISESEYYKIKSVYKGKNLNLYTSNLNNPSDIISALIKDSLLSDNKEKTTFAKQFKIESKKLKNLNINLDEIKEFLKGLNNLKKEYPFLDTVIGSFSYFQNTKEITNKDTFLKDNNEFINVGVELTIKEDKKTETAYVDVFSKDFDKIKIMQKIKAKIESTYDKLNFQTPNNMKVKVLLTNEVMSGIFDNFIDVFFAKNIRLKQSVMVGKLNKKIFSNKITIVEDPANTNMVTSNLFDGEGTQTYYKEIVKEGVFKTILYDNKEAIIAKTKSTGNSNLIKNCYLKPGKMSFNELIKKVKDGIIVDRVDGLHVGTRTLTGDIALQCQGYIVKNGKKDKAIKMFVMTTNIFELLGNVIAVGNDLENFGLSVMFPSILVENINISGE